VRALMIFIEAFLIHKNMESEKWKDVLGYKGLYQVSDLGNIKSLSRTVLKNGKYPFVYKGRMLIKVIDNNGYYIVSLYKNGKQKTSKIHQLVTESFLNHITCGYALVVNHINFIKTDNRVDNLEIVTQRQNSNLKHIKSSSKYVGVSWDKKLQKWSSYITIKKNRLALGHFTTELEAYQYYENALIAIKDGLEVKSNCKKVKKTSKYKGVGFHKASGKYRSRIIIKGKHKHIGYFISEIDAHIAYEAYKKNINL
jgi:hypothetical protein